MDRSAHRLQLEGAVVVLLLGLAVVGVAVQGEDAARIPIVRSLRSSRPRFFASSFASFSRLTSALMVTWLPSMRTPMSSLRTPGFRALSTYCQSF